MDKASIKITFDAEKLGAVKRYMGKKDALLDAEMEDFMQKLYEKYVPPAVRDYIETRNEEAPPAPQKPSRPRPTSAEAASETISETQPFPSKNE